ncbi:MAG: hypothetical protein J6T51_02340, partial [Kiritimatiellae bacterium]|nr:hypothetical protein [Kiritimatiellia bacterium]
MRAAPFAIALLALLSASAGTNDLFIARNALRDELWDVARSHAAAAGSNEEARLVILESYAREGRWKDVREALARWQDAKGNGIGYYRAVTGGDHAAAAKILKGVGSPEGLVAVRLFEAEALAKSGDRAGAERLWR